MEVPGSSSAGYCSFYHIKFTDFTIIWYLEQNKIFWKQIQFLKSVFCLQYSAGKYVCMVYNFISKKHKETTFILGDSEK